MLVADMKSNAITALQYGVDARIIVLRGPASPRSTPIVFVNPSILSRSAEEKMLAWREICLVLPPPLEIELLRDDVVEVAAPHGQSWVPRSQADLQLTRPPIAPGPTRSSGLPSGPEGSVLASCRRAAGSALVPDPASPMALPLSSRRPRTSSVCPSARRFVLQHGQTRRPSSGRASGVWTEAPPRLRMPPLQALELIVGGLGPASQLWTSL